LNVKYSFALVLLICVCPAFGQDAAPAATEFAYPLAVSLAIKFKPDVFFRTVPAAHPQPIDHESWRAYA
jgi:hypothetical protein